MFGFSKTSRESERMDSLIEFYKSIDKDLEREYKKLVKETNKQIYLKLSNNMKKNYRFLLTGETSKKGDQYLNAVTTEWTDVDYFGAFDRKYMQPVRREVIPTILVNGFEVPEPIRKINVGEEYYFVNSDIFIFRSIFGKNTYDNKLLKIGNMHSSIENAAIHAKALFAPTLHPDFQ